MRSALAPHIRATHSPLMAELETVLGRIETAGGVGSYDIEIDWRLDGGVLTANLHGLPPGAPGTLPLLAARAMTERSRRWRDGTILRVDPAWRRTLQQRWPGRYDSPIITGDGWSDLLIAMAGWLGENGEIVVFDEIKAKYEQLRAYHAGSPSSGAIDIIESAELLSQMLCETCGAPAKERPGRYIQTLCGGHANGQ